MSFSRVGRCEVLCQPQWLLVHRVACAHTCMCITISKCFNECVHQHQESCARSLHHPYVSVVQLWCCVVVNLGCCPGPATFQSHWLAGALPHVCWCNCVCVLGHVCLVDV